MRLGIIGETALLKNKLNNIDYEPKTSTTMTILDKILYCVKGLDSFHGKKEVVLHVARPDLDVLQSQIDEEFDEYEDRFIIVREKVPNQLSYSYVLQMFGINFIFYVND